MARRRYMVTYDVSDDRRRAAVFSTLRDYGDHVQYSVYRCELDARELVALRAELSSLISHSEDQVLLVDLGLADRPVDERVEHLGRPIANLVRARII